MPARGHASDIKGNARRAAERYVQLRDAGEAISADAIASQYRIAVGTLYSAAKNLRKERAAAATASPGSP